MRRSSRLFVGGTERFESVSKSLLLHILIRAIIRFEQLRSCEVGKRQIFEHLPTSHPDIPLTESNSVTVAKVHLKVILTDPEFLFNTIHSHRLLLRAAFGNGFFLPQP